MTPLSQPRLPPGVERQDDEVINFGRLIGIALAALAVFAVGIVYALWLLDRDTGAVTQRGNAPPGVLAGCRENPNACAQVGIVEQRQFELEQRAATLKKTAAARLDSYGWADQAKGVARIPIGEAMKKVVEGERSTAGGGVTAPPKPEGATP